MNCKGVRGLVRDQGLDQYRKCDPDWGVSYGNGLQLNLDQAIELTPEVSESRIRAGLDNIRNKLSHLLVKTAEDRKSSIVILPPTLDDLDDITKQTVNVAWLFHSSLNNADFDFDSTKSAFERNASNLWNNLHSTIDPGRH